MSGETTRTVYRVYLDGRHVATRDAKQLAEALIASWLREWDGEFTIKEVNVKGW